MNMVNTWCLWFQDDFGGEAVVVAVNSLSPSNFARSQPTLFLRGFPSTDKEYWGNGLLEAKGEGTLEMVKGCALGVGRGTRELSHNEPGDGCQGKLPPPRQDILGNRPARFPFIR